MDEWYDVDRFLKYIKEHPSLVTELDRVYNESLNDDRNEDVWNHITELRHEANTMRQRLYSMQGAYQRLAGEVEARNVETRMYMSEAKRKATSLEESEMIEASEVPYARSEQIVTTIKDFDTYKERRSQKEVDKDSEQVRKDMMRTRDIVLKNKGITKTVLFLHAASKLMNNILKAGVEQETWISSQIKEAQEDYVMIPNRTAENVNFQIDKSVDITYLPKPNATTVYVNGVREVWDGLTPEEAKEQEALYKKFPFPLLYDSNIVDKNGNIINTEYADLDTYQPLKSHTFDPDYIYRGMSGEELNFIIKNKGIKSNARLNIGKQQEDTTSFAQHPSQATYYAQSGGWQNEGNFNKPKYVVKVAREGVVFTPTTADVNNEIDVIGTVPLSNISDIYELNMAQVKATGMIEFYQDPDGKVFEGSRSPNSYKRAVRKIRIEGMGEPSVERRSQLAPGVVEKIQKDYDNKPITVVDGEEFIKADYAQTRTPKPKPFGTWFARGSSWVDFVRREAGDPKDEWYNADFAEREGNDAYVLDLDESKILRMHTLEQLEAFTEKYGEEISQNPFTAFNKFIRWERHKRSQENRAYD